MSLRFLLAVLIRFFALWPAGPSAVSSSCLAAPAMLRAGDFGAVGDGEHDDAPALQAALEKARETGPGTVLTIPAGRYLLKSRTTRSFSYWTEGIGLDPGASVPTGTQTAHLVADRLDRVTLRGEGRVELLAADWDASALALIACTGVSVENLTIAYAQAPFAETEVLGVDPAARTLDVRVRPGSTSPSAVAAAGAARKSASPLVFFHPQSAAMDVAQGKRSAVRVEELGGGRFRLQCADTARLPLDESLVGRSAVLMHRSGSQNALRLMFCAGTVLQGVTLRNAPGPALMLTNCREGVSLLDCRIEPEAGRALLSSCADGVHGSGNRDGLTIRGSRFLATGDDSVNSYGFYTPIASAEGRTFILAQPGRLNYKVGDSLVLVDMRKPGLRGQVKVAALHYTRWRNQPALRVTLDQDPPALETLETLGQALSTARLFTQKGPLPTHVINPAATGGPLVIEDNEMGNHLYRAVLVRSEHALIRRNHFRDMRGPAVYASPELGWPEGHTAGGLRLLDNRFTDVRTTNVYLAVADATPGLRNVPQALWHREVTIADNQFEGYGAPHGGYLKGRPGEVVFLGGTDGAVITDNQFGSASAEAPRLPLIELEGADHVRIAGNRRADPERPWLGSSDQPAGARVELVQE